LGKIEFPMKSLFSFLLNSPATSPVRVAWWSLTTKLLAQKNMAIVPIGETPHRAAVYDLCRRVRGDTAMLLTDPEAYGIYATAQRTAKIPGGIAELGVFRGGSARLICEVKGDRPLHLFDTFSGLPDSGAADTRFKGGSFASSFEQVQAYLKAYPNVHFHQGFFPGTAAGLEDLRFCFVHLDGDLYESTLSGLEWFYPRLNRGGVLISHDYYGPSDGVGRAFDEYFADKPECLVELSGTQVAIVKL
jgi:O-methyltransferase